MNLLNVIVFTSVFTACLALTLAGVSWRLQRGSGRASFIALMSFIAVWTFTRALEALAVSLPIKILWAKVEYLGIASVPTLWMLFTLSYLSPRKHFSRRSLALLAIFPALILGMVISNDLHGLYWSHIEFAPHSGGVTLVYSHGPLFWLAVAYNYLLVLYSMVLLVSLGLGKRLKPVTKPDYTRRRQVGFLCLAAVFPWLGNAVYLLDLSPVHGLDLTPLGFTLGGMVILLNVFQNRLFDLVPAARDLLVEDLRDAIFVLDDQRRVANMNAAARRLAGLQEGTHLGQPVERLLSPWYHQIAPSLDRAEPRAELCLSEDPPFCVELQVTPISDQQAGFSGKLVVLRDITKRKLAEKAIQESEKKYRGLIETLQEGIWVIDHQEVTTFVNPHMAQMLGFPVNEIVGRPIFSFFEPAGVDDLKSNLNRCRQGATESCDFEFLRKDGSRVFVTIVTSPLAGDDGSYQGAIAAVVDVTGRRLAEQQLAEALDLNRKMISASSLGILVYGDTGHCRLANGAAARIVGGAIDDLLQQNFRRITSWQASGMRDAAEKALSSGQPETGEFHITTSFGAEVWLDCYFTPFSSGGESHLLLIFNDISERVKARQAEYEQRVLAEALRDTAAAINQNLDLAGVQERILTNISRVVPHDSASIALLDGQDRLQVVHAVGYTSSQLHKLGDVLHRPLEGLPHLLKMVDTGQPVILPDTWQNKLWPLERELPWVQAYAGAPVFIKGRVVGFINLESAAPGFFHPDQSERLQAFAHDAAIALDNARLHAEVLRLTIIDELTHVYNYRGLLELGEREFERAYRFERPLSALFVDLDHFHEINNRFSHSAGNEILCEVAQRFQSCLRAVDLISRYGGDEFVILLPEITEEQAILIAERLRQVVGHIHLPVKMGELRVTASIGVACLRPGMTTLAALLDAANQAEHRAKASGRNCVIPVDQGTLEVY